MARDSCHVAVELRPFVRPRGWPTLLDSRILRAAFVSTLVGLVAANAVAIAHVALLSGAPKSRRWASIHDLFSPVQPFAAFEYLMNPRKRRHSRTPDA
jgi:hypothetical protein